MLEAPEPRFSARSTLTIVVVIASCRLAELEGLQAPHVELALRARGLSAIHPILTFKVLDDDGLFEVVSSPL